MGAKSLIGAVTVAVMLILAGFIEDCGLPPLLRQPLLSASVPVAVAAETDPTALLQTANLLTAGGLYLSEQAERDPYIESDPKEVDSELTVPTLRVLNPDQVLVGIYCTHGTESYEPTFGAAKSAGGAPGGIISVASALQKELAALGVGAVFCRKIHDYPEFSASYTNSLASLKQLQADYPTIEIFVDVHRDAGLPEGVTKLCCANGSSAAKILLVVGSDQRAKHDNWQQNHSFARQVGAALEAEEEGILRGVRVQNGRYNQFVDTRCILTEIGDQTNTLAEAEKSAEILARTLFSILSENN